MKRKSEKRVSPLYKKTFKVGILLNGWPDAYINAGKIYSGFTISLWKLIKKRLDKMGIKYVEKYVKYKDNMVDWGEVIELVERGEYDIFIAGVWLDERRIKSVNFTYPLYMKKQVIVYNISENSNINYKSWLKNLLKLWLRPFIALVIISIVMSIILYLTNSISFSRNIANTIEGFFGQTSALMFDVNENKHFHIFRVMVLVIVLIFHLYIASTSASESVIFLQNSNLLEYSLEGQKILVGGPTSAKRVKDMGGIPILIKDNLFETYIKYQYDGVNGFLSGGEQLEMLICNNNNLKISNLDFGYEMCGFPINKKEILFRDAINKIIIELRDSGKIKEVCDEYSPGRDISTAC